MKITIITVCYNSAEFIRTAVESVLAQTYSELEYIVIDGGSSDDTLDVLSEYKDQIARIISEPDQGIYDAMNKGIALATGDIIGILNSDDFYPHCNVLVEVATLFEQSTDFELLFGNVGYVSPEDLTKRVRFYSSNRFRPWKLKFGFMPAHPATFVKKSAYKQTGDYKLGYKIGADFDMFVRMLLVNNLRYRKINKTLVTMRTGGVSTSGIGSYITSTKEMVKALKENKIYSNYVMIFCRLPIKYIQRLFHKYSIK